MAFYLGNVLLLMMIAGFCSLLRSFSIKCRKKYFIWTATIQMIVVATIRGWYIGADTQAWVTTYQLCQNLSWEKLFPYLQNTIYNFEPGYIILNKIVSLTGLSITAFYFVVAVIIYVSVARFVYRYSNNVWFSMALFWMLGGYQYSLGILRQTIACAICLWAVDYIIQRKSLQFAIIVALAIAFHSTALCIVPLYSLYNVKVDKNYIIKVLLGAIGFLAALPIALRIVGKLIPRYKGYAEITMKYGAQGGWLSLFISMVCIAASVWYVKHRTSITSETQLIMQAMTISFFLHIVTPMLSIGRMAQYYDIYRIIFISNMLKELVKKGQRRYAYAVFVVLGLLYYAYTLSGDTATVPYTVVWKM